MSLQQYHREAITTIFSSLKTPGEFLGRPVDVASLAVFRLFFGAIMVWEVTRYFNYNWISRYFIQPTFYFPYEFFSFLTPLPGSGMHWLFAAMGFFALALALGLWYRLSALFFCLTYTYVFLLDKTPYNNHYYLIILLSFLLIFVDAQRWLSVDRLYNPRLSSQVVPFWQLFIFRAQIFIVYFYGGLAKLNADWLTGEPMRTWLANRSDYPIVGSFFTSEWTWLLFSYGGLFFDLSIGFLLLSRHTRLLAFVSVLFFNLTNAWLFSIGVFPYLMIAATILFVEPHSPRQFLYRLGRLLKLPLQPALVEEEQKRPLTSQSWIYGFVGLYLILQILIPLRHWLYSNEVSWSEEGHRFSWHMKLRDKQAWLDLRVTDPTTGQSWPVDLDEDLTQRQIEKMADRPDMIVQYAHYLAKKLQAAGIEEPIIKAESWASLNGRPPQHLIDPQVNLAQVHSTPFASATWILPLTEEERPREAGSLLQLLTIMMVTLVNAGLVISSGLIIKYGSAVQTQATASMRSGFHPGLSQILGSRSEGIGKSPTGHLKSGMHPFHPIKLPGQTLTMRPAQPAYLLELTLNALPYFVILLSLLSWAVTGETAGLAVALAAAVVAGIWSWYLIPFLTWRSQLSSGFFRLPLLLVASTGLLILATLIIVT